MKFVYIFFVFIFGVALGRWSAPHTEKNLKAGTMEEIKGIARVKFKPGKIDKWKRLTKEAIEIVRTKDKGTLQYEIFFNADETEAIVFERYRDADSAIKTIKDVNRVSEKNPNFNASFQYEATRCLLLKKLGMSVENKKCFLGLSQYPRRGQEVIKENLLISEILEKLNKASNANQFIKSDLQPVIKTLVENSVDGINVLALAIQLSIT
jgi:quinol monooxygenase YgiN